MHSHFLGIAPRPFPPVLASMRNPTEVHMKATIHKMKTAQGVEVEYVRLMEQCAHVTEGKSLGLWRFTAAQIESIRSTGTLAGA